MILRKTLQIRHLTLRNRLVMPPMASELSDVGTVSERLLEHYRRRTQSQRIGLVIAEHSFIRPDGKASAGQLDFSSDAALSGLRCLTETLHENDTPIFAQLNHAGSNSTTAITGYPLLSASPVRNFSKSFITETPRALTREEIGGLVRSFAQAAVRAKAAGFDGVEIHAAHGYLLNQFYTPLLNFRTDEYGPQSVENRVRFHTEVLRSVRQAVGEEFPIAIRLGGSDYMEGGSTIADAAAAAKLLEAEGADLMDLSGGMCHFHVPGCGEPGFFRDMSAAVKEAVSIPVMLTGGVQLPEQAEALLHSRVADLIGVGRAMLKNPDWADF